MINIRPYTLKDQKSWDNHVQQHSDGTVFHLTAWKQVIEKTFNHKSMYFIAEAENERKNSANGLMGVLPLFRIKSFVFGDYLVSIPFAELGGILAENKEVERKLLEKAIEIAKKLQCDYLELRNRNPIENLMEKSLYYNFKREIFPNIEENLKSIPRKARRMIRQGQKLGLNLDFGTHLLPEFYKILSISFYNLGTPIFPQKLFKNFIESFGKNIQIFIVRSKEKIAVAGVLVFFFKDQVVPYYAGSIPEYRNFAPNDFMYWELMRYGYENGYKIFDFGRSKIDTGSYHFKRHWGFDPNPLSYQYYLVQSKELPNLSPANPKYQKKIELWKKLPLSVTKIFGPAIARYLA